MPGQPHGFLRIGELARLGATTTKAIRFYETTGLLLPNRRGANGYRLYDPEAADVLRFIKQASGLGLTLGEVKEIIAIRRGGRPPCAHVHRLLRDKVQDLDTRLADLLVVRRRLRQSLAAWGRTRPGPAAVCPHIERGPGSAPPPRRAGRAAGRGRGR